MGYEFKVIAVSLGYSPSCCLVLQMRLVCLCHDTLGQGIFCSCCSIQTCVPIKCYAGYWRHYRCKDSPLCYFSTINLQTTFKQDINMRKQVLIHLTNRGFEGKYTDKRFKEAYRKCPSGNPALKVFWIIDYLLLNY